MTYKETLAFLYRQLPMYQRIGSKAFKKDLSNIIALSKAIGNPHKQLKSIHIAGTNGKGTVSHMLASVFQAAGFKTGLYTSPHYRDFRERIKTNGQFIPKRMVIAFVNKISPFLSKIKPSFFEITVAMAFDYFANAKVDIAIVETGLGGRLDSTNILHPKLSVITNISFDHVNFLGPTLQDIAGEKAGIIKEGVPVLIGEHQPEVENVFKQKAKTMNASIHFAEDLIDIQDWGESENGTKALIKSVGGSPLVLNLVQKGGPFQQKNIITALGTLDVWNHYYAHEKIAISNIQNGFLNFSENTQYIGRWQILGKDPLIIADSAHNEAGLRFVLNRLSQYKRGQLHFVLGFVNDKNWQKLLAKFPRDAHYYLAKARIPRGLEAKALLDEAKRQGLQAKKYVSIRNALRVARRAANTEDLIFVGGSTFTVAEVV